MHPDGLGLYLHVSATGARSWIYRFMLDGRARHMGLGPTHIVSLAEARAEAAECRRLTYEGTDPIEARAAERTAAKLADARAMTFRQCAEAYIASHEAGWKNPKHAKQWPATLAAYVYPAIGDLPVQAIDAPLVMKAVQPIWTTKPETAGRVRGRIESILDWAAVCGYRQGENPARWKGHLEHMLPKKAKVAAAARQAAGREEHHAALPYAELPAFMAELRDRGGLAARALEFLILTAARTAEAIGAKWPEIDDQARLWTVPASRMKAGKEHRVPLSAPAQAILKALPRRGPGPFPVSNMAMTMALRRMGRGAVTVHGFRSTFADWATEKTNTPSEVREMALAHSVGSKVEEAYRRTDLFEKRRELMDAWARYCAGSAPAAVVVPLRPAIA
jgi:integrase